MTSHRQVFRSSAIIGGASVINMMIGVIKVKVLAVLAGPAGIGLMGLYQNIIAMASTAAGCGIERSGVRQLAASAGDAETLSIIRRALWLGNLLLGTAGMAILWMLREPLSQWVFGDRVHAGDVGWLGVGLVFTLMAGSQTALLQGLRRIDELAKVTILSAVIAALVGILAVYLLGESGVVWFVLTAPAANFLVASYYAARIHRPHLAFDLAAIQQQWLAMLKLGIPLVSASLLTLTTQLVVRAIVQREYGLEGAGHFQAAWAISFTYLGFVLNAMTMDYYPRLTMAIGDREHAKALVNEQAEMALLVAGPVLLAMITLAPWVIRLLYADGFDPAAELLQWQVLGGIFKVASAPLVFIFLATGRGGTVIGIQLVWAAAYLAPLMLGIGEFGLVMTGIGFYIAFLAYFLVVAVVANRLIGFRLTQRNWQLTCMLMLAGALTMALAAVSTTAGYAVGLLFTLSVAVHSWRRLNHLIQFTDWLREKFR